MNESICIDAFVGDAQSNFSDLTDYAKTSG